MALYASALYNGKGIKSNKTEAINYFKMSIETGNINAMRLYGLTLLEDDKNSIEGFNYLKMAAEKGDVTAMEKMGDLLFDKQNATEDDYDESFNYYKMAYLKNPTKNCMSHIRSLIQRGLISANNIDDRTRFIKESADNNNKEAMKGWFFLKQNRKYCESSQDNLQEGAFYLKKAADLGDADAMLEYSRFLTAQNEERNQEEARHYSQMASILGNRNTKNINNDSSNKPVNQTTTTTNNKSMQKQNNYNNRSTSNNKNLTNQTSNRSLIDDDDLSISSEEVNQMDRTIQPKNQSSTPGCKKIKLSKCAIGVICFVGTLALILIIYFAVH